MCDIIYVAFHCSYFGLVMFPVCYKEHLLGGMDSINKISLMLNHLCKLCLKKKSGQE